MPIEMFYYNHRDVDGIDTFFSNLMLKKLDDEKPIIENEVISLSLSGSWWEVPAGGTAVILFVHDPEREIWTEVAGQQQNIHVVFMSTDGCDPSPGWPINIHACKFNAATLGQVGSVKKFFEGTDQPHWQPDWSLLAPTPTPDFMIALYLLELSGLDTEEVRKAKVLVRRGAETEYAAIKKGSGTFPQGASLRSELQNILNSSAIR